jgi:hypothetical protein
MLYLAAWWQLITSPEHTIFKKNLHDTSDSLTQGRFRGALYIKKNMAPKEVVFWTSRFKHGRYANGTKDLVSVSASCGFEPPPGRWC